MTAGQRWTLTEGNEITFLIIYLHSDCHLKERRKIWVKMPMHNVNGYYEDYCIMIYIWKKTKHPLFPLLSCSGCRALLKNIFIIFFKIKTMFVSVMSYCPEIHWKCRYFLLMLVTLSLFTSVLQKRVGKNFKSSPHPMYPTKVIFFRPWLCSSWENWYSQRQWCEVYNTSF